LDEKDDNLLKIATQILDMPLLKADTEDGQKLVNSLFDLVKEDKDYALLAIKRESLLEIHQRPYHRDSITIAQQAIRYHKEAAEEIIKHPRFHKLSNVMQEINEFYKIRLERKPIQLRE
jgi:hypothetical protein